MANHKESQVPSTQIPPTATSMQPLQGKAGRRLRNYLLQPLLQVKLGLYTIVLAALFSASLGVILYVHLGNFATIVLQLTDVEQEVTELLHTYMKDTQLWLALATSTFLLANIVLSVVFTHRLVGPTYAFRRHIRRLIDGDYTARTILRKGDAFQEVARDLNRLSERLEKRHGMP